MKLPPNPSLHLTSTAGFARFCTLVSSNVRQLIRRSANEGNSMKEPVHTRGFRQVDQATDPQYYFQFLDEFGALESVQECRRLMLQLLQIRAGHRLLDVGCGVGDDVRDMARHVGETGKAVGLDNSYMMVAEARRRSEGLGLPVEFVVGDAENLDFPSESFDGCSSERTFMYLDARRALEEMMRVTKPGAAWLFSLWTTTPYPLTVAAGN